MGGFNPTNEEPTVKTITNRFGEKQTTWTSYKHPNNSNFMQVVEYTHIEYPDGRKNLLWRLNGSAPNDMHIIPNLTLDEALTRFADEEVQVLTDADFQKWLSERN